VVQATSSSYKKAKQTAVRDKFFFILRQKGHGKSAPARLRKSDCPAYGHKCGYCNREHHFEKVCRSKEKSKTGITTHNTLPQESCPGFCPRGDQVGFQDQKCPVRERSE
jgi:hypothetical protein